ncbi:hypothetical protein [Streptosporangium saharense]|uniref:Uncharacterized protein n=1 Tax=Streptosporangium saharense TaxID=1706840 RepID=A0A7W7QKN6_9ACTN|nr:hypothetical protein [Streptosporangium saharense]MBB4915336.1 hypothetical protein [Streptosporangium saharense]
MALELQSHVEKFWKQHKVAIVNDLTIADPHTYYVPAGAASIFIRNGDGEPTPESARVGGLPRHAPGISGRKHTITGSFRR